LRNPGAIKRQKELARQQRRQDKLADRARRNQEKKLRPPGTPIEEMATDEVAGADSAEATPPDDTPSEG